MRQKISKTFKDEYTTITGESFNTDWKDFVSEDWGDYYDRLFRKMNLELTRYIKGATLHDISAKYRYHKHSKYIEIKFEGEVEFPPPKNIKIKSVFDRSNSGKQ